MFNALNGKPDAIVDWARKWSKWPMYAALFISLFIALFVSEESLRHSYVAAKLVGIVSSMIPAINQATAGSQHPVMTAVLFSFNWLFVPVYFFFTVVSYGFWNDDVKSGIVQRWKTNDYNWFTGMGVAMFMLCIVLTDCGVIPAMSAVSIGGYQWAYKIGALVVLDAHPVGIALLYFAMCVFEGFMYGGFVFVAAWYIYSVLDRKHMIRHHT